MLLRIVYSIVGCYAQCRRSLCGYDCQASRFVGYFVVALLLIACWCDCVISYILTFFSAQLVVHFVISKCSFYFCSEFRISFAKCLLIAVSRYGYRSCCDRQFFCTFQFTSILLASHTNFNRCTICYIGCCNLCRTFCPCSVRFLIFNLDSIKICFCFLSWCCRNSCCMRFSIINFCHISRSQCDEVFNLLFFPVCRNRYIIIRHLEACTTINRRNSIQAFNSPSGEFISFACRFGFNNNILAFIMLLC